MFAGLGKSDHADAVRANEARWRNRPDASAPTA